MTNREKSIELLNRAVSLEIETVFQYLYFHFHCEDRGYDNLAKLFRTTSITEMEHIDMLADRIIYLKGDVIMKPEKNITYLPKDSNGDTILNVDEVLKLANQMEQRAIESYNQWAAICSQEEDSTTKRLFERLIEIEENHQDTFDTEGDNYKKFGDTYLALQSIQRARAQEGEQDSE